MKLFKKKKKDLLIKTLEFCYKKNDLFTAREIKRDLKLNEEEIAYLMSFCSSSRGATQMFQLRNAIPEPRDLEIAPLHYLRLTPNAIFHYLEYVELVQAKRNARLSTFLSIVAISLAAITTAFALIDKL